MKCPFCGTDHQTVVIMTRSNKDRILRRRKCLKCGRRFWTAETVVNG